MIVYRVAARAYPEQVHAAQQIFARLVEASRRVPGVVSFDVAQDVVDPAVFVSVEVYEDQDALERQGLLPEVDLIMSSLDRLFSDAPRGTVFFSDKTEAWPS